MAEWRWLLRYAASIKRGMALAVFAFLWVSITEMGIVFAQQKLIDDVFLSNRFDLLGQVLVFFAVVCGLHIGGHAFGAYAYVGPYRTISTRLTREVMDAIHRLPIRSIRQERTARFVHHLSDDVPRIGEFMAIQLPAIVAEALMIIVFIYTLAYVHISLMLFVLLISIVYSLLLRYFQPRLQHASREAQDRKSALLVTIEEGISSTRDVLAYHRQAWEQKRYDRAFFSYFTAMMDQGKLVNRQLFVSEPIKRGAQLMVLAAGGWLALNGTLSPGMFIVAFAFSNELITTFHEFFGRIMKLSDHLGCVERIRRLLGDERLTDGKLWMNGPITELRFEQVSFRYPSEAVNGKEASSLPFILKNLTVNIPAGRKIAFVGESGGGKSTIVQLLARFYEPTEGTVRVNDIPLHQLSRDNWANRVGFVFQEPYLFPDTVMVNLTMGRTDWTEDYVREVCRRMLIDDGFASLPQGYHTIVGERGITLSGGQRQRLALARAVLANPEILILDEATSALDLETERELQENLDQLRSGRTTIIVAHRLSTVQNADRIIVMDGGTIAEQGTHEELMRLRGLYSRQVHAHRECHSDEYKGCDKQRTILGEVKL